jgi:hypothetical protein
MKLEVEQPVVGRLEGMGSPAEVDGDSTAKMEGDHVVGLKEGCRPGDTWVERPLVGPDRGLFFLSSSI